MRVLRSGLGLVESPRWHDGRLWFADWIAGQVIAIDGELGESDVVIEHQSLPLCFDFLVDGTPLVVSGPRNLLLRADGSELQTYADLNGLSSFGGNDIVVDGRNNAYVDNVNYDAAAGAAPTGASAPGFIALVTPDGSSRIVADDLAFPNGIAVTADNRTLIVAESHRNRLSAFRIDEHGSLDDRWVWADLGDGAPDGICIDSEGAVWYADVPNQRCVRVAEGGEVLDQIDHDRGCFACMLGGPDGRTLFIVAAQWHGLQSITGQVPWDGQVVSVPVSVAGSGWPIRS